MAIKKYGCRKKEQQNGDARQVMHVVLPEETHRKERLERAGTQGLLTAADVTIDLRNGSVTKKDKPVHLTGKEYELLLFLTEQRGRPWKAKELYERIWRETFLPSASNTVMVHILRLRSKIEDDPSNPKIVRTIYGKGYQVD